MIILKPSNCHAAYVKAAEVFAELYQKVTNKEITITETDDGKSDLIVIGSDAVNDFLMNEVFELNISDLGIRYGTEDFCILSHQKDSRKVLILAGGRGRSTLYAVYDYFERFLGCHYFWDGDVIPRHDDIPMDNIHIIESPHFDYRGLRYFAHRGLKRFQAEHWSFEDWKRELDWMSKKKLNFLMLRIGMDDIWQRAFPDDVPYPDGFRTITGKDANGFDDRSDFWTLKYRGELKIKVLEYARTLDLMYPTDCGTMTHWYSRTPEEFLKNRKPSFCTQEIEMYTGSDTGRVFDFTKQENMDYYMRLTETMVEQHEKDTALFHTIGLGERMMYKDRRKNFALKQIAYRRIAENIRLRYPNSKLMLASWDFAGTWTPEEVQNLIKELDPERTLILDYTSEGRDPENTFLKWGVNEKFPWIFGLFHAYEAESDLRGPYDLSNERLKVAASDPYCNGMVLWPELSHSDPLILEYLTTNAWSPLKKSVPEILKEFCENRYGKYAEQMNDSWQHLLPLIKLGDWGGFTNRKPEDEQYWDYFNGWHSHQDIWTKPLHFLNGKPFVKDHVNFFDHRLPITLPTLDDAVLSLRMLHKNKEALKEPFILRDAVDMTRTVLGRMLNFLWIKAIKVVDDTVALCTVKDLYFETLDIMTDLLSTNPDFSLLKSLRDLQATAPTNPEFEATLKRNILNNYCSQPAYELVAYQYKAEAETIFEHMLKTQNYSDCDFMEIFAKLSDRFQKTPLTEMQPTKTSDLASLIKKAADCTERVIKAL